MRRLWLFTISLFLLTPVYGASEFPTKPIRLLVGYATGGPTDAIGRAIARELESVLEQPVVVENKAGAAGRIALDALTRSQPDGYTIGLLSNSTTTSLHYVNQKLDMNKRFIPLAQFVATRLILAINPEVIKVKNLREFVELAKRKPALTYTSSGHGSPGHLGMEMFIRQQGIQLTHVPYRGSAPAMLDVIAGRVGIVVVDASTAAPFIKTGQLRPIVTVSTVRAPGLPDLPTATELGETAFQIDSTMSLVVPPKTPISVVEKLRAALKAASDSDGFTRQSRLAGNAKAWLDEADYKIWLQRDFERWGKVIKDANIVPQPK